MCFLCFRFCLLCSKLKSVGHYLWGKQNHDAIHSSRNLETACCTVWQSGWKCQHKDFRVFQCQSVDRAVDLKRGGQVQWWLWRNSSLKASLIILIRKKNTEFVGKIQITIDNNSSKSIRSISRVMGLSKFLIKQVVHEDICFFSNKMRKGQFLLQAIKEKRKNCAAKLLNKLKHFLLPNMLWFFSDEKKFQPRSDGELAEQLLACSVPTGCPDINENQTLSPHHGVFFLGGGALPKVTLCLRLSSHMASISTRRPTSSAWRRRCCSELREWLLEDPMSGNRTLHHAIQAGKPSVSCQKISMTSSLTSGHLTPQTGIPLIILCEVLLNKRPSKLHATSKMNQRQG